METAGSTKMVAPVYQTTWQHIPEHHIHHHEKQIFYSALQFINPLERDT